MKIKINWVARCFTPVLSAIAVVALSGCAPAIFVGGATAAVVAGDERSTGSFVEDQEIELKVNYRLSEEIEEGANVDVTSYNRRVLLTGQVISEDMRRRVLAIVEGVGNIREIHDQMQTIGAASFVSRTADKALTVKVKAALCTLRSEEFSCLDVKVVTERGIVYLLGLVTRSQAATAVRTVRDISGVQKVVKIFEYVE